jgi:hypothetical protein
MIERHNPFIIDFDVFSLYLEQQRRRKSEQSRRKREKCVHTVSLEEDSIREFLSSLW